MSDDDALSEKDIRQIVRDELGGPTRRGVLAGGAGLLGGALAAGASESAAAQQGDVDEPSGTLDVGSTTSNTYRITNNKYGGPDSATSELTSELGSTDTGAKYIAEDTGALYHWDGAAWNLMDSERGSITTDLGSSSQPAIRIGTNGAGLFVNSSGEVVVKDEAGHTITFS